MKIKHTKKPHTLYVAFQAFNLFYYRPSESYLVTNKYGLLALNRTAYRTILDIRSNIKPASITQLTRYIANTLD